MAKDDHFVTADKMLAAMDFAAMSTELEKRHRAEMANLICALLPVLDSLEALRVRCRELHDAGHEQVPYRSVDVVAKQMMRDLNTQGVEAMNAAGCLLDLDKHEVSSVRTDDAVEEDTVLEELRPGFLWRTRVLRQALVVVSRRSDGDIPNEAGPSQRDNQ